MRNDSFNGIILFILELQGGVKILKNFINKLDELCLIMNSSRDIDRKLSYHIITTCEKDLLYDVDNKDYSNVKKLKKKNKIKLENNKYCGSVFIMDL